MIDRGYVRIASWHVPSGVIERAQGSVGRPLAMLTRCGRRARPPFDTADYLPLDAASCETCLRLSAHDQEPSPVADDTVPG